MPLRYRASWNGAVLAESDDVVFVEGNAHFPSDAIRVAFWRGVHVEQCR